MANITATGTYDHTETGLEFLLNKGSENEQMSAVALQISGTAPTTIEFGMKNGDDTFTPFAFSDGSTSITALPATIVLEAIPHGAGAEMVVTGGSPDFYIEVISGTASQK